MFKMKRKTNSKDYGVQVTKRPKILYELSDLPNEMMQIIFKSLTPKDRRNVMLVSHFWMRLVNEYFPKDNTIVLNVDKDLSPIYQVFHARLGKTKALRSFYGLKIECFTKNFDRNLMLKFIELICDEIRFLRIFAFFSDEFNVENLYIKFPNLETLQISHEMYLGDLAFPPNLKSINIDCLFTQIEKISDVRNIKSLESFTSREILIKKAQLTNDTVMSFMNSNTRSLLNDMVKYESNKEAYMQFKTNFNFCGEAKLAASDVSEMILYQQQYNILPLCSFENLKVLEMSSMDINSNLKGLTSSGNKLYGVTKLKIFSHFENLDEFLRLFPNLEFLQINNKVLNNEHFSTICKEMPKLKHLCYLTWNTSEISLEALFARDTYSLKDLKKLESLSVRTKQETYEALQVIWPNLPCLKIIHVSGSGWRHLKRSFYAQMAKRSPKLTEIRINYNSSQFFEFSPSKFFPLITRLKNLREFIVPGSPDDHGSMLELLAQNCRKLTCVTINDGHGFSLEDEMFLFEQLPKLAIVGSADGFGCIFREMYRSDFQNIKGYLSKSLQDYKDMDETITFLYNEIISRRDLLEMDEAYNAEFSNTEEDDDFKMWYVVIVKYLEMSQFDLCRAFYYRNLEHQI